MPLRVLLVFLCLYLATACENEPYQYPPMGVISLTDYGSKIINTYRYRDEHLHTFTSGADKVTTSMKFTYADDELQYIVKDSIEASRTVHTFYRDGNVVIDTARLIEGTNVHTTGARTVTFDSEGNPVLINKKDWTDQGLVEEEAELVWDNGNVIKLTNYTISSTEKKITRELTIEHDDQYCVYMWNPDYLYTLPLKNLFWLSKNNPIRFNDGSGNKKYTYWYNKMGYPSNFKDEAGTLYGANYTQIR